MRIIILLCMICLPLLFCTSARAEFIITSAIVDFTKDTGKQQDIEMISRSKDLTYIVNEVYEITNPGKPNEARKRLDDPTEAGLLVTPDKTILAGGSRRLLRFIELHDPDNVEHIYRVDVKPVIRDLNSNDKIGIKILVGYGVLVIVRPNEIKSSFTSKRSGLTVSITNNGNTNLFLQANEQCPSEKAEKKDCKMPPSIRVYADTTKEITLPFDRPVSYTIWDGAHTVEKTF